MVATSTATRLIDRTTLLYAVTRATTSYETVISVPKLGEDAVRIAELWYNAILRVQPDRYLFRRAVYLVEHETSYTKTQIYRVVDITGIALNRYLHLPYPELTFATSIALTKRETDIIELIARSPDAEAVIDDWLEALSDSGYWSNSYLRADRLYILRHDIAIDQKMDPHGYIALAKKVVKRLLTQAEVPCSGSHWG